MPAPCGRSPNKAPQGRLVSTTLSTKKGPQMPCRITAGTCTDCCGSRGVSRPTTTARVGTGCSRKPFYGSSSDPMATVLNTAVAARTSTKADTRHNQVQHLQITGPNHCPHLLLAPGYIDVAGGAKAAALANATKCCSAT